MKKVYQKYLISYKDGGRDYSMETEGKPVVIPRFKGFGFFVHRMNKSICANAEGAGWSVSEVITGRELTKILPTIAEAIRVARLTLRHRGKNATNLQKYIDNHTPVKDLPRWEKK